MTAGDRAKRLALLALPSIAAAGTAALVPASAPALALMRMLAAFGGGTAGSVMSQGIEGGTGAGADPNEVIDPNKAFARGGLESLGTGGGDFIGGGLQKFSEMPQDMAASAMALPPVKAMAAGDVANPFLRQKIKIGRPGLFEGTAKVDAARQASSAAEEALAKQSQATALKSEIADEAYHRVVTAKGEKSLNDAQKKELYGLWQATRKEQIGPGPVPMNANGQPISQGPFVGAQTEQPMTMEDVLKFRRSKDAEQRALHQLEDKGVPRSTSAVEDQYEAALADVAREHLYSKIKGFGRQSQNTSELIRLKPAMANAEVMPNDRNMGTQFNLSPSHATRAYMSRRRIGNTALGLRGPAAVAGSRAALTTAQQLPRTLGLLYAGTRPDSTQ
jgi:hypothetical protein